MSSGSARTMYCCAMRSIELMRFTSERLARAACAALNTAFWACPASRSVFQAEYMSAIASGSATSRKPAISSLRNERGKLFSAKVEVMLPIIAR